MLLISGDGFWLASISLWMTQCIDQHSEATSSTQVVKPESHGGCSTHTAATAAAAKLLQSCLTLCDPIETPYYTTTKWPIQLSWYVFFQSLE